MEEGETVMAVNTGSYCPACINFFDDTDVSKEDLIQLTEHGADVYCPNGCTDLGGRRIPLEDPDVLEVSHPQMDNRFEKKKDELAALLSKANEVSHQMTLLSYTYVHKDVVLKDFNNY